MSALPEDVLTEMETAALLRISVKGLQGWRYKGNGPKFLKLGRAVRYRRVDLQDFVLKALRTSTSDPGPGGSPRGLPAPPRPSALLSAVFHRPPTWCLHRRSDSTR
jgi:Helix-turn-helix domain